MQVVEVEVASAARAAATAAVLVRQRLQRRPEISERNDKRVFGEEEEKEAGGGR